MNENQNEFEIRIQDILAAFFKRWWLILIAAVLGGVLAFGYSYATHVPVYRSTAKMYVNNESISIGATKVSISSSDITAAQSLVNTYCEILKTRQTLELVNERAGQECAGLDYTYEQLLSMLSAGPVNETEIFYITVVSTNPEHAIVIADTITKVLPEQIATIIEGSSVRTVDKAVVSTRIAPRFSQYAAVGALIGLVLSLGLVFVFDVVINDTLESEEWIINTYREEIPLLAVIPDVDETSGKHYGKYYASHYYATDSSKEEGGTKL